MGNNIQNKVENEDEGFLEEYLTADVDQSLSLASQLLSDQQQNN